MMQIVIAGRADIDALVQMENVLFSGDRISRRQFVYLLTKAKGVVVKAELDGDIAGYMILLKRQKNNRLRVYSIGVAPSHRKQGLGGTMISYAEKYGRDHGYSLLSLEVCEYNESAVQLYKAAGFSVISRRDNYYDDGCTALHMVKKLVVRDSVK